MRPSTILNAIKFHQTPEGSRVPLTQRQISQRLAWPEHEYALWHELRKLVERGLLRKLPSQAYRRGSTGYRYAITDAGLDALRDGSADQSP